jgi:hypothetical protein
MTDSPDQQPTITTMDAEATAEYALWVWRTLSPEARQIFAGRRMVEMHGTEIRINHRQKSDCGGDWWKRH